MLYKGTFWLLVENGLKGGEGGSKEAHKEPVEVVQGLDNGLDQVSGVGGRHG